MTRKLTPELKAYKEEFDFIHKKIGELEWERITLYFDRTAIRRSESEVLEEQLENYRDSMELLIEKIESYISDTKKPIKKIKKPTGK